nr:unnamed protein product [Digitaria exilis]
MLQLQHVADAGEEAEPDVSAGCCVDDDGTCPALPELGDEDVEARADIAAGERRVLRLELVDVGGREVERDVLKGKHRELRERAGLDVRVREAVPGPDGLHTGLRQSAGDVADGIQELRHARAVRHRVVGAQAHHEAAAVDLY